MKIVDNYKPSVTRFCDLEQGVVFLHKDTYYMKLQPLPSGCPIMFNAVSLVSGVITTIIATQPVRPVDGEFVAKKVNA